MARSGVVTAATAPEPAERSVLEDVVEREENGLIILSPRGRTVHRRLLHVNSYGGKFVWERIKRGLIPNHQLLGCLQLVRLGYEVALAEPLKHFYLYRQPFPHDLKLLKAAIGWLGKDGILFSGHTLLYWLPLLKSLGILRCQVVSLMYAREDLDWARFHTGILALTPAAYERATRIAPSARVAHVGWGADLDFFKPIPYHPEWFLSCGIANRDFATLATAAALCNARLRVVSPGVRNELRWSANVEVIDGGRGWSTDQTKRITARQLIADYFPGAAGILIVMNNDPTEYTANGFTNLMEAMASALPVIVTRTGALPGEIDVEASGCGLYVPAEDPDALAAAMRTLADDPGLAAAMGKRGRALVDAHYNIEGCATRLHDFFESI